MDETNHHLWKPVMIGEVQANGQLGGVEDLQAHPRSALSPYIPAQ